MTRSTIATRAGRVALAALLPVLALAVTAAFDRTALAADDHDTREAKALYVAGLKHYNIGRYDEAIKAFEAGYLRKPDPSFLFNLGQCYRMKRDPDQAIRQYRAYLRASPEAENRAAVEGFIHDADEEIKGRAAATGPRPPQAPEPSAPAVAPTPAASASATPVYKKWWLWTIVGGVAAVGLGVGLGVGLSQKSGDSSFPSVVF